MGFIEKRNGKYRARYRDPLGRGAVQDVHAARPTPSGSSARCEADKDRGHWIDPRGADVPLAEWAEEFLPLCRRLAPTTQETYRRDLDRYVLPRFGSVPARPAAGRRDRELAQRRARGRPRAVVGPPPLPDAAPGAAGRRREAERSSRNPCDRVDPPRVPQTRDGVPRLGRRRCALAEAHTERFRALIYLAVDSGHALERARRAAAGQGRPRAAARCG